MTDQSVRRWSGKLAATARDLSWRTGKTGSAVLGRTAATAMLAASLVLSLLPPVAAQVVAAPPEPVREAKTASSADGAAESNADPGSLPPIPQHVSAPLPGTEDRPGEDGSPPGRTSSDSSSVRPRGLEAPVELEQQEGLVALEQEEQPEITNADSPRDEKGDPGDGPVRKLDQASQERDRAPQGMRIWPLPADSYTFTQQFGCVPQLGNLYFPGEGCPAEAPVIHTGVDLAAPEGTVFYAAASGWVTLADYDRPTADANTRIIIQHDGRNERYATDYLHWIASYVEEGDYVRAGDPIGEVGSVGFSTGPHLHFSVTDLDTGENIDPLRWLPEEAGLEGYVSRRPAARLRLPPGTTAGQPESADPAPPEPPVREDVPKNPPDESGDRERSERKVERKGDQRREAKGDESATDKPARSGKKRNREDAATSEASNESAEEKKAGQDRSRERERTRERNRNGSTSEAEDTGEDGQNRDNRDDSRSGNNRRDRGGNDAGGGGNQERDDTSGRRDKSGEGGQSDSGGRGERNGERQDQDQDSAGRDKGDSDAGTPDDGTGDSGDGERTKRDRSSESDAVVTPPRNERTERNDRDQREKS